MLINKKLTTAIAAGAIIVNALTLPVAASASTAVGVLGNGAESTNTVNVTKNNTSTATQNNTATITNNVNANSNTGGNDADFNTGGNTKVKTGDASNALSISNTANSNFMSTSGACNCDNGALIEEGGNGAFSDNNANFTSNNNNVATQNNAADFENNVKADANTGKNSASDNTGGDNAIMTGAAKNWTDVENTANQNVMTGGGMADPMGNGTTLKIDDNGALSDNNINATSNNNAVATQDNAAVFSNNVDANAKTGKNSADFNTDGSNSIMTGSAENFTGVANVANKNVMDAFDCGCATGDLFKEAGNGAFATNTVNATDNNNKVAAQDNAAQFANAVDPEAFSGNNSVSDATGSYWFATDPSVKTGDAGSQTEVQNTSNENVISDNGVNIGGMNFQWNPAAMWGSMGW